MPRLEGDKTVTFPRSPKTSREYIQLVVYRAQRSGLGLAWHGMAIEWQVHIHPTTFF